MTSALVNGEQKKLFSSHEPVGKDWTMAKENDQQGIHSIHIYPARMVPQVVRDLIKLYGREGESIGDFHAGSGTVPVEALRLGYDVICSDINPLSELLTRVKCTPISPIKLEARVTRIRESWDTKKTLNVEIEKVKSTIPHLEYWFKPKVIEELVKLRHDIFDIEDRKVRDFFKVCFSYTVRRASNIRTREFKLYRRAESELQSYSPNVLSIFLSVVKKGISGMTYIKDIKNELTILHEDARNLSIKSGSVGMILTSPPYGDSTTTVAYGQFSKYPLLWLGYPLEQVRAIDQVSFGGKASGTGDIDAVSTKSPSLHIVNEQVKAKDFDRSQVLMRFFRDLDDGLKEMRRILKDGRTCIIIIGNRTMREVRIPTIQITRELAEAGWKINDKEKRFECLDIKERHIYQKRLPYVGAPQGRTGEWQPCDLIMNEAIIVLKSV